jgi:hypothetical protein
MEERMKNKGFILALLLSMIAAMGAWAQNLPGGIWASPQSTTTEGRYRSNADDFIRPDYYSGIKLNKWFGLVSFNSKLDSEGAELGALATAGFATKISKIYIGAFYSGDFWTWAPTNNYTERQFFESNAPAGGSVGKTYDVYGNINVVPRNVNNAAILIGIADMGFRLTYRTNHHWFKKDGIVTGNDTNGYQLYQSYQAAGGYIAPQIAWAMAKDLTKDGIRPYATFDLVLNRNYQKMEPAGGTVVGEGEDAVKITGERIYNSENHLDPSLGLGMGGYTFYNKNGFKGSVDFDYVLTMNIYSNEYSYVEDDQYKTGKIKGTFRVSGIPLIEEKYMSNLFTPSLSGSWSADRLALKFKLNLPLTLINEESNNMGLDSSNNLIRAGISDKSTTIVFRPDLRLALQYKIIPDRLVLNTGARIQTTAITAKTTKHAIFSREEANFGEPLESSKVHERSFADNTGTGSRFASRFHLGATFNFTENAWVEAMTGVSNAYGDGAIEIFTPGGLFSFGGIMVGLKF